MVVSMPLSSQRLFSVCALCYGDYPELSRRCLVSLAAASSVGAVLLQDFRIGLNACSPGTFAVVSEAAGEIAAAGVPVYLYRSEPPEANACKYPLMRRMFWGGVPLASRVMWFDDDSYLTGADREWWLRVSSLLDRYEIIGKRYLMPVQGRQWEWIQTQPWYNPAVGLPRRYRGRPHFEFRQGAWWAARSDLLRRLNWPLPELRHNGGDSLLGEACRHIGASQGDFEEGVRINADAAGRHSGAKRRGHHEPVLGKQYQGEPLGTSHQDFECLVAVIPAITNARKQIQRGSHGPDRGQVL